ncbi:MAG: heme NO-binding domain-containing protein, partial [Ideonella sp.]|nr:heme NO-binding domain-containing protein [Ideonella sp.]
SEAGWQRVCALADTHADGFVSMQPYDDELTYKLVSAVTVETGLTAEQVLEAFGEYWILYTAEEGYGQLLDAAGDNLRDILGNLNDLHGRVETVFPHMHLPIFSVEDREDGSFDVIYDSHREGLAPMVAGLIRGLAKRSEQTITLERQANAREAKAVFRVRVVAQ